MTCIQWIPGSPNQFLVSHTSGHLYVYNEELTCGATGPTYQLFKQGEGFSVHTCKTKSTRNPLYRGVIGDSSGVNEFAFSPCSKYLAVVSQDGFMRVLNYDSMELVGSMKSYFGGLLCVCWSPDGKYIVTGGEDDLVTVWSFAEKRVVCRGQGHKSWVNVVSFDAFTTSVLDEDGMDMCGSDDDFGHSPAGTPGSKHNSLLHETLRASVRSTTSKGSLKGSSTTGSAGTSIISYRFGSVSQDTHLCLWDLTEDILRQPFGRLRTSTIISQNATPTGNFNSSGATSKLNSVPHHKANSISNTHNNPHCLDNMSPSSHHNAVDNSTLPHANHNATASAPSHSSFTQKFATLALGERKDKDKDKEDKSSSSGHKRAISLAGRGDKLPTFKANCVKPIDDSIRLLGTPACPRLDEVPLLEPLICKKIAHERLTSLVFRDECMVTACQEGFVCTWARPGKVVSCLEMNLNFHLNHSRLYIIF